MSDVELGYIVYSTELHSCSVTAVQDAATRAGIPVEYCYDVRPRSAFIRAARELKKMAFEDSETHAAGILAHKFRDDPDSIEFQFSEYFLRSQGVEYDATALVRFDKHSMQISCVNQRIKELAERFYQEAGGLYSCNDIQAFMKRVLEKSGCRRVIARDGVYFIPTQYKIVALQLKTFMNALGFGYMIFGCLPEHKQDIIKAVVADVKHTIMDIKEEIAAIKEKDSTISRTIARNRLKDLKEIHRQYQEIATSLQTSFNEVLEAADDAGSVLAQVGANVDSLITSIQRQDNTVNPLIAELVMAQEEMSPTVSNIKPEQVLIGEEAKIAMNVDIIDEAKEPELTYKENK